MGLRKRASLGEGHADGGWGLGLLPPAWCTSQTITYPYTRAHAKTKCVWITWTGKLGDIVRSLIRSESHIGTNRRSPSLLIITSRKTGSW